MNARDLACVECIHILRSCSHSKVSFKKVTGSYSKKIVVTWPDSSSPELIIYMFLTHLATPIICTLLRIFPRVVTNSLSVKCTFEKFY